MLDNELKLVSMPRIDKLRYYLEMVEKYFIDSIQEFY